MFEHDAKIQQAKNVQHKYTDSLMQNKHVVGVSVRPVEGYVHRPEEYALIVLVDEDAAPANIPSRLDDVPVIVQKVGKIKAQ